MGRMKSPMLIIQQTLRATMFWAIETTENQEAAIALFESERADLARMHGVTLTLELVPHESGDPKEIHAKAVNRLYDECAGK